MPTGEVAKLVRDDLKSRSYEVSINPVGTATVLSAVAPDDSIKLLRSPRPHQIHFRLNPSGAGSGTAVRWGTQYFRWYSVFLSIVIPILLALWYVAARRALSEEKDPARAAINVFLFLVSAGTLSLMLRWVSCSGKTTTDKMELALRAAHSSAGASFTRDATHRWENRHRLVVAVLAAIIIIAVIALRPQVAWQDLGNPLIAIAIGLALVGGALLVFLLLLMRRPGPGLRMTSVLPALKVVLGLMILSIVPILLMYGTHVAPLPVGRGGQVSRAGALLWLSTFGFLSAVGLGFIVSGVRIAELARKIEADTQSNPGDPHVEDATDGSSYMGVLRAIFWSTAGVLGGLPMLAAGLAIVSLVAWCLGSWVGRPVSLLSALVHVGTGLEPSLLSKLLVSGLWVLPVLPTALLLTASLGQLALERRRLRLLANAQDKRAIMYEPVQTSVAGLASLVGLQEPEILLLPHSGSVFVASYGRRSVLVIDPALWELLDEDEQSALVAHELAHLVHGDADRMQRTRRWARCFLMGDAFAATIEATRSMEERADLTVKNQFGVSPAALASAVRKASMLAESANQPWSLGVRAVGSTRADATTLRRPFRLIPRSAYTWWSLFAGGTAHGYWHPQTSQRGLVSAGESDG